LKYRVAILTIFLPTYRSGFYDRVMSMDNLDITVYCQDNIPESNLKSIHDRYGSRVKTVPFFSVGTEMLVWHHLPLGRILSEYDVVFVDGNPRILSHFFIGTLLQLLGKKVVLWTMVNSFRGNSFMSRLRLFWSRMFSYLFVYTDVEATQLRDSGWERHQILGMNNGLDQNRIDRIAAGWSSKRLADWQIDRGIAGRPLLLSIGRLIEKNQFDLIPGVIQQLTDRFPDLIWVLVGEGPERGRLQQLSDEAGVSSHILFVGSEFEEERLAPWFLSAEAMLFPGAIGLTVMHAFGYGLPLVTHNRRDWHGPEFGIFSDGKTGFSFNPGDVLGLRDAVLKALQLDEKKREIMSTTMLNIVRNQYNVDIMATRFAAIAHAAAGGKKVETSEYNTRFNGNI
jgi:glycosyltransferase involved in cell wall biosynthesis